MTASPRRLDLAPILVGNMGNVLASPRAEDLASTPVVILWHGDGRFTRLEGAPCDEYAAALAASGCVRGSPSRSASIPVNFGPPSAISPVSGSQGWRVL